MAPRVEHSKPLLSLDVHAEAPGDTYKLRRMTELDRSCEASKVAFHKTIDGRYRDGRAAYDEVGVLLITWQADDLFCGRSEVPKLRDIFNDEFGFITETFEIPSERSATALHRRLADFAYQYDGPNKMSIVYYGGHGALLEDECRLRLFAKSQGDWRGDPSAFFDDAIHSLKLPDTDILVIVDCCYAALAFRREEMGNRKFELLSAVPSNKRALPPEARGSFTEQMCIALQQLLGENPDGFTTSKLYRKIYFRQEDARKPLLFDQSPYDYGKIWLKSQKNRPTAETTMSDAAKVATPRQTPVYVDLKMQLTRMPDQFMLSELARSMQYLPHVKQMTFEHLHAPEEELKEYMRGLKKALVLRPLLARLRQRLEAKRMRKRGIEPGSVGKQCPTQSPLHLRRRIAEVDDWGGSKLVLANMQVDSVKHLPGCIGESTVSAGWENQTALGSSHLHTVGSMLSFTYSLDSSGLRGYLQEARDQSLRFWQRVAHGSKLLVLASIILLVAALTPLSSAIAKLILD